MSFIGELKRRNVFRAGAAYVVTAWLLIQVAETIFPLFGFDEAPARIVVIVLAIGLVPALTISWAFEWTPHGLVRESAAGDSAASDGASGKRMDRVIMAILAMALAFFAVDKFVLEPKRDAAETELMEEKVEEARQAGRIQAVVESYGERSIAVLPFVDMSPEGDQEYLSDGIAEELLNLLAAVPEIRVISRTSSFAFKGQALEVPEIARRLNVSYVLEGSVRKSQNQIRVTAQLIEAASDTQVWSKNFDRELEDVFAIQDDISAAVVDELQVSLLGSPATQLATANLDAYQLYLEGRFELHRRTADSIQRSIQLFEEAISLDPEFARAYLELATAIYILPGFATVDRSTVAPRARSLARKARSLDPALGKAVALEALIHQGEGNWKEARSGFEEALQISRHESIIHLWYATLLASTGQTREALHEVQLSYELDPQSGLVSGWLCAVFLVLDETERASRHCGNAVSLGFVYANFLQAQVHLGHGEFALAEAALSEFSRGFELDDNWVSLFIASVQQTGDQARALDALNSLEVSFGRRWDIIGMFVMLGDNDRAFDSAVDAGSGNYTMNHIWMPIMRSFRQDPRFALLMDRMGLISYWQEFGWPDSCHLADQNLVCE